MKKQSDVSARAIRLARFYDRLAPGRYFVVLEKPAKESGVDITAEFHRIEDTDRVAIRPHRVDRYAAPKPAPKRDRKPGPSGPGMIGDDANS